MRFPVGLGNKADFDANWYDAQPFGSVTSYGRHEGADINRKSGGDTDLGEPIYAIADYELLYYHINSHPTTGFGIHYVYKIIGPWGNRWCHVAHNQSVKFIGTQQGKEGVQLSTLGKSGTSLAHLHFAIFKLDPASLAQRIDQIAHNDTELNQWWEDPIKFINQWISTSDYYRGYDLNNKTSMKVAVDALVDLRDGLLIRKGDHDYQMAVLKSEIKDKAKQAIDSI